MWLTAAFFVRCALVCMVLGSWAVLIICMATPAYQQHSGGEHEAFRGSQSARNPVDSQPQQQPAARMAELVGAEGADRSRDNRTATTPSQRTQKKKKKKEGRGEGIFFSGSHSSGGIWFGSWNSSSSWVRRPWAPQGEGADVHGAPEGTGGASLVCRSGSGGGSSAADPDWFEPSDAGENCSLVLHWYNATQGAMLPVLTNSTIEAKVRVPGTMMVLGLQIRRPGVVLTLLGYSLINILATCIVPMPIATSLVPLATILFGFIGGMLVNVGTTCVGAYLCFLLVRHGCRPWFLRALGKQHSKWHAINEALAKDGWQIPLLIRCSPVSPVVITNILLSLTSISPFTYVWTTFVGETLTSLPYAYGTYVGASLIASDERQSPTWAHAHTLMHIHSCTYTHARTLMHVHSCTYTHARTLMHVHSCI